MRAMQLQQLGPVTPDRPPLVAVELPVPEPGPGEIRVRVEACAVCHTELDEIEGRTTPPVLPVIPGHQIVGRVEACGAESTRFSTGERVGIGWIFSACGRCEWCRRGEDNLCPAFRATGRDVNGGYAEYVCVREDFTAPIPEAYTPEEAAPLLCAGAIGYRSLRLAMLADGQVLGLSGFGGSNHLVLQLARHLYPCSPIFVYARSAAERAFALCQGASWAGDYTEAPPRPMDAVIDTTPVWKPILSLLPHLAPGGRMVINAIRKENTDREQWLQLDYARDLWQEKIIRSVANVASRDIVEFLPLAAQAGIKPEIQVYALDEANRALQELRAGKIRGSKVLRIGPAQIS